MTSIRELLRLDGRTALVTGGAGHIALAVEETLMELGADVAALLNEAEDIVNAAGREIVGEQARAEERRARKKKFRKRRR